MGAKISVEQLSRTAAQAARKQDWRAACAAYADLLERFPKNQRARKALADLRPRALPELLASARQAQQTAAWAEAEADLRAAWMLAPEMPEVGLALGACQLDMGRAPAAMITAQELLSRDARHVAALNLKGRAEREMGRLDASRESLLLALEAAPEDAQTLNSLAATTRSAGDMDAAMGYYRRALASAPDDVRVHCNFAQLHRYVADDPHLADMRALAAKAGRDDPAAAPLHFALFKALDDTGATEEAFDHLQRANRLTRASDPYDFQQDALPYAVTKALFSAAPPRCDTPPLPARPVFVLGLPRTGTSLVERMLARDPSVQPCGELAVVQLGAARLLRAVMGRQEKRITAADIAALREELTAGLSAYSDGRPVMIDKMPLNFRWIGCIRAALPEARIVHLTRDPMAVAWSLLRLDFAGRGQKFIHDPEDIARFMVLHREYMAHWHSVYPDTVHELSYEALVADPEGEGRALADAVGLDWSPDWLRPEEADAPTLTASFEQVRRPIYAGSNAAWERYAPQLAPLRQALEKAGLLA